MKTNIKNMLKNAGLMILFSIYSAFLTALQKTSPFLFLIALFFSLMLGTFIIVGIAKEEENKTENK